MPLFSWALGRRGPRAPGKPWTERDVEAWFCRVAPADVRETLMRLEANGFTRVSMRGGQNEPFGNALIRLSSRDIDVVISRDRSQWALDFVLPDGTHFDLEVASAARRGWYSWEKVAWDSPSFPLQWPAAPWALEALLCANWLRSAPTAVAETRAAAAVRKKARWGA